MKVSKIASVVASAAIAAATMFGGITIPGVAAQKEYKIADLINEGKAKTFGRHKIEDGKMSAFWSGNGFEVVVNAKQQTTLTVTCQTNDKVFLMAFVDGEAIDRLTPQTSTATNFYVDIAKGKHTVRVVRDSQILTDSEKYFYFDKLICDCEILKKNPDNDTYIEVIGDSIACGCGALGTYVAGKAWTEPDDHSAVKGFGYRVANILGADYSLVCRGGIGLLDNTSGAQEVVKKKVRMQDIYRYTNAYVDFENNAEEYAFERKPDLILLELGANDSNEFEFQWQQDVKDFIAELRQRNGSDIPIVWVGANERHYSTMKALIAGDLKDDGKLYAFRFPYGGSGSAALTTQSAGHPSSNEQKVFAEQIVKFLEKNGLAKAKAEEQKNTDTTSEKKEKSSFPVKEVAIGGGAVALAGFITGLAVALKRKKRK